MSAGIYENDRGHVQGDTWHKDPLYIRQDTPVTIEQALSDFDYPMEIRASYGLYKGLRYAIPGSNHIVRTDIAELISPMVGDQFTLMDTGDFVRWVESSVMKPYPDITIESCGTLYNGQTQFLSLVIDKYHVHGDESDTLQRILFTHAIGKSAYLTNLNEVRTLCDNTRRAALANGQFLKKVPHTSGANDSIRANILELTALKSHFANERAKMDFLADTQVTVGEVDEWLEAIFPTKGADGQTKKGAKGVKKQAAVKNIFEGGQYGFLKGYDKSAYALFNALTDYLGNQETKNTKNPLNVGLDNLIGSRAGIKDKALALLLK